MSSDPWSWLGSGGGDIAKLMRNVHWEATKVGPVTSWPTTLKSIVSMMLHARQPMFLWWGPEFVQFYNDGYVPSFGVGRHPSALGQQGRECWADIWPTIGPEISGVVANGQATFHEDALVPIHRNGRMEEVYWTYGYSPVFELDGSVAGVLVVVTETTSRVLDHRRLRTGRDIADAIGVAVSPLGLGKAVIRTLNTVSEDVPWALIHRLNRPNDSAELIATDNLSQETANAIAGLVADHWSRALVHDGFVPVDLSAIAALPGGPWPEASTRAVVMPMEDDANRLYGRLIVGLSPRLPYDEPYRDHLRGLCRQLSSAAQRIDSLNARMVAEGARNDLLMQAPVAAALLVGPQWRYELANDLYVHMVGRPIVGRTWHEAFPELRGSQVEEILAEVYRSGRPFLASEQLIAFARESDGVVEDRFFDFNMIPIRTEAGSVEAMMVVAVEITAQVRARQELERTAIELSRVSRAKDHFVAMLGHELRNPLAPITTALRVMELRGIAGLEREREVIARQVQHLTRLVDDLLDVARIATGKVALSTSVAEMADVVSAAIEVASPLIEQRHQRLTVQVPRSGLRVSVDLDRMTQVFANLLTNASKYGEEHAEIRVSAEKREAGVVVRVEDSGVGIDAEMLPVVFDLFSQERQSIDRAQGGLGLGLAIVKNLVSMHGGSVSAHSEGRGKGSTFTVVLPLATISSSEAEQRPRPKPVTHSSELRRVLIVDDNRDSADMLALVLNMLGHTTKIAEDGPEALTYLEHFPFDVALLDIGLPAMDGYELARRLRLHPISASARLFALTGYGQQDDVKMAQEAGFDAHFVKPVNVTVICEAIKTSPRRDV
jgi:signal transduction histidine kinase/ActR/RegA family two-component response regulator